MKWFDMAPVWAREMFEEVTAVLKTVTTGLKTVATDFKSINRKLDKIMAMVQVDQSELDVLAGNMEAVKDSLATEIALLQQGNPQADLTGLNKALADFQALTLPPQTPTP